MTNREEVIRGIECCVRTDNGKPNPDCKRCPYFTDWGCKENGEDRILLDALVLLKAQKPITGETSDGYHTFNELYHHRAVLFSVIVANYKDRAWKSVRHHDGTMYDGMFIVGIDTPDGQATYHYDIDPYWDMFDCKVREFAPEWDGHMPAQAIERIGKLKTQEPRVMTLEDAINSEIVWIECSNGDGGYGTCRLVEIYGMVAAEVFMLKNKYPERNRLNPEKYLREWRCLTSRPDEKVRVETPWED